MRRRYFIALFGSAATWRFPARAEQTVRVTRIGFLGFAPRFCWNTVQLASASSSSVKGFLRLDLA
jgi:hypothetical protein